MQRLKTWLRKWLGVDQARLDRHDDLNRIVGIERELAKLSKLHVDLVRQVGIQESNTHAQILAGDTRLDRITEYCARIDTREETRKTLSALSELITATGENFTLRMEDLSRRVIDLETEPKQEISNRQEDSPGGRGSFAEIVAEIERANGIR